MLKNPTRHSAICHLPQNLMFTKNYRRKLGPGLIFILISWEKILFWDLMFLQTAALKLVPGGDHQKQRACT